MWVFTNTGRWIIKIQSKSKSTQKQKQSCINIGAQERVNKHSAFCFTLADTRVHKCTHTSRHACTDFNSSFKPEAVTQQSTNVLFVFSCFIREKKMVIWQFHTNKTQKLPSLWEPLPTSHTMYRSNSQMQRLLLSGAACSTSNFIMSDPVTVPRAAASEGHSKC